MNGTCAIRVTVTHEVTTWWFQIFFIFTLLGEDEASLTCAYFFRWGWFNHHLDEVNVADLLPIRRSIFCFHHFFFDKVEFNPTDPWSKSPGNLKPTRNIRNSYINC